MGRLAKPWLRAIAREFDPLLFRVTHGRVAQVMCPRLTVHIGSIEEVDMNGL